MVAASRPYSFSRSHAGPEQPNSSCTPTRRTGVGSFSLRTAQTASPRPPMTLCSSAVMTLPHSFGRLEDDLLVQRLDGVDVDDAGVDALGGQLLGSHAGLVDHQAGGDDGNVVALGELLALADLEVIVGLIVEHGHGQTAEAQVDGALHRVGGARQRRGPPRRRRGR